MVLMTIDHASGAFNAGRLVTDSAFLYEAGTPLPAAQFFLRWITHLCAPSFVFLAGVSLGLSVERRTRAGHDGTDIDRHLVTRGLFIALLDPLFISLFWGHGRILLQVLYAIGVSMVAMAALRHLSTTWLFGIALALVFGGELLTGLVFAGTSGGSLLGGLLLHGTRDAWFMVAYPLAPWLSFMMLGWVFGRHLVNGLHGGPRPDVGRLLAAAGVVSLAVFIAVRGLNAYGNMRLWRDDSSLVQWLHVSKYPPSLSFATLELGLMCVLLSLLFAIAARRPDAAQGNPLLVFGQTPLFFYLLHIPLLELSALALGLSHGGGIAMTLGATAAALCLLYPLCRWYRAFKRTHSNTLLRYV